ncbi:MAG: PilZ domain-containing protein [Nitrospiraceae bacterium]
MELRGAPRYRVVFHSSFSSAELVAGEAVGSDLSDRGCRVRVSRLKSPTGVCRGTELQLHLILPENDHYSPVNVERAVVQWTEGNEFGVEFLQLADEAAERIRRFVSTLGTEQSQ